MSLETVNHPDHYNIGGIEAIAVIEAWGLNFALGSAIKYLCRAGRKPGADALDDLRKAEWYIRHEIEKMTREAGEGDDNE